jgi:hypothetical protein
MAKLPDALAQELERVQVDLEGASARLRIWLDDQAAHLSLPHRRSLTLLAAQAAAIAQELDEVLEEDRER